MHCAGLVADAEGAEMCTMAENQMPWIGAGGPPVNMDVVSDTDEPNWRRRAVTIGWWGASPLPCCTIKGGAELGEGTHPRLSSSFLRPSSAMVMERGRGRAPVAAMRVSTRPRIPTLAGDAWEESSMQGGVAGRGRSQRDPQALGGRGSTLVAPPPAALAPMEGHVRN